MGTLIGALASAFTGAAAAAAASVTLPATGLLAYYDARNAGAFTLSTENVDAWLSEAAGNGLTAATTTRPLRKTDISDGRVKFDGGDRLVVPAGISLSRQSFSVFIVTRGPKPGTTATYFSLDTTPDLALYQDALGQIIARHTAAINSGVFFGYTRPGLNTIYAIGSASNFKMGHAGAEYVRGSALTAGTETGGHVGAWGGGSSFYLPDGTDIEALIIYNAALSDADRDQVLDYCTQEFKSLSRASDSSFFVQGDSLSVGVGTTVPFDSSWPAFLARAHTFAPLLDNRAAGGKMLTDVTTAAEELLWLGRNSEYTNRILNLWIGTNDISSGRTATQVNTDIDTWITTVRAADAGALISCCTIVARAPFNATQDGYIADVNTHIKTVADVDLVIDLAAQTEFSDSTNTTYFNADAVHMNETGYTLVASIIRSAWLGAGWL